jgi:hypothetical protein
MPAFFITPGFANNKYMYSAHYKFILCFSANPTQSLLFYYSLQKQNEGSKACQAK